MIILFLIARAPQANINIIITVFIEAFWFNGRVNLVPRHEYSARGPSHIVGLRLRVYYTLQILEVSTITPLRGVIVVRLFWSPIL